MPTGIQIINTANTVQIDDTFFNYAFISKHTLTFQNAGGPVTGGFGRQAFLTVAGERPIIAARCGKPFTVSRARPSPTVPGQFEFGFIGANFGGIAVGDTIDVYVFDRPPARPGSGSGIQVFDASQRPVFDSAWKYLKVVDSRQWNGGIPTDTVNLGAGTWAHIITVPAFRWTGNQASPTSDWMWACFAGLVTTTANGYTVGQYTTGEGSYAFFGNPAPRAESQYMQVLTIDVAGY